MKSRAKLKIPESVHAPPLSSDDDEDDGPAVGAELSAKSQRSSKKSEIALPDISESSGDELAPRGNIRGTKFSRPGGSTVQQRRTGNKGTESPYDAKNDRSKKRRMGDIGNGKRTRKSDVSLSDLAEHPKDERMLSKTKKVKATYKRRPNSSQEQDTGKAGKTSITSRELQVPDSLTSPRKQTDQFRTPLSPDYSPSPDKAPSSIRKFLENVDKGGEDFRVPMGSLEKSSKNLAVVKRRLKKKKQKTIQRSPSPPPAVFKLPASISKVELRTDKGDAASTAWIDGESDSEGEEAESVNLAGKNAIETEMPPTVCPWCGESVDKKLLDDFSKGKRLNVRSQTKFCQKHKKQTATEVWRERNYPQVEWDSLDKRFTSYRKLLLDIINGAASHFRSVHERNIEAGKARSMKNEDNMNPGYYGPRGFNLMCDYLVNEFGDLLKKKAVDDRVIAGRGSAAFIQTVLVAELAVQLIMEDMGASEEDARAIMEESKAVGELVHEDE
ncbi:uncharacterized protein UV8b_02468 [Ustilaginoidea virens]|uniref:Restriction of telomere capping protein 4 n=1 Tax=Ustilaginoidea virens TaxID=1159556 RepID=A0A8E5MFV8_USTVR|nr:uncharacterized protein UV8b_02468 [Ustilaginoidea virens]QUC18227.1 hypothetical protein UV8b_02468 [Ustilaginoidea virens]